MPSSNVADTIKAIMNPITPGTPIVPANPANRASVGAHQLDLVDEVNWQEYYDARYGTYGSSVRGSRDDFDPYADYRDPYNTYRREKQRRSHRPDPWDKPTTKGPSTYTSKGHTMGYSSGTSYSPKKVYVQHKDGSLQPFTLPWDCNGWYDLAKQVYPMAQGAKDEGIVVPIDRCEFTYAEPTFNACVYQGTQDYISARWGRKLDDSDRRWLAKHPLATDGGIPQEYTATAIQQLIQPYGMRISRIRIRAGSLVLGDHNMQWAQALGCNPMALADRRTSNADAAAAMGLDPAVADQLWRLEFSDRPLPGSIIGERGWTNTTGVSVGSLGGHARYLAPRAGSGDWFISIQLAPEHEVDYLIAPPDPEYIERKGAATLRVGSIVDPNGELIAVKDGAKWRPWAEIKAGIPATPTPAVTTTTAPVVSAPAPAVSTPTLSSADEQFVRPRGSTKFQCGMCGDKHDEMDRTYDRTDIDICIDCAEEAWHGVTCPECRHEADWNTIPYPLSIGDEAFDYQCQKCKSEFTVPFESNEPFMKHLIDYSYYAFAAQIDAFTTYGQVDPMDVSDLADVPPTPTPPANSPVDWNEQIWD